MHFGDRVDRVIEIRDAEIDADRVKWLVREGIRRRGAHLLRFDSAEDDFLGWANDAEPYLLFLDAMAKAEFMVDKAAVGNQTRAAYSFPDRLLSYVRQPLHQLVLYYVNLMVERQRFFNLHVVEALKALTPQFEAEMKGPKATTEESLQNEVRALEEQLRRLETIVDAAEKERQGPTML